MNDNISLQKCKITIYAFKAMSEWLTTSSGFLKFENYSIPMYLEAIDEEWKNIEKQMK